MESDGSGLWEEGLGSVDLSGTVSAPPLAPDPLTLALAQQQHLEDEATRAGGEEIGPERGGASAGHLFDSAFVPPAQPALLRSLIAQLKDEVKKAEADVSELESDRKGRTTGPASSTALLLVPPTHATHATHAPLPRPTPPLATEEEYEIEVHQAPEHCIPIRADVRTFKWMDLAAEVQFDAIVLDPPWQLASAVPTRGVALGYKQLPNKAIEDIPIPALQKNGFIFIWVINSRYNFAIELMEKWGYKLVDDLAWVKTTVNRRLAKGHGFYLQHAKETCLVGKKGEDPATMQRYSGWSDVIFSERRGQSQKPEEIYELIEGVLPNGKYLEIFARRNNLRNYWVSVGLEL